MESIQTFLIKNHHVNVPVEILKQSDPRTKYLICQYDIKMKSMDCFQEDHLNMLIKNNCRKMYGGWLALSIKPPGIEAELYKAGPL